MRTSSFRAFLMSLLLALIACASQPPSTPQTSAKGQESAKAQAPSSKGAAAPGSAGEGSTGQIGGSPADGLAQRGAGNGRADAADSEASARDGFMVGAAAAPEAPLDPALGPVPVTAADPSFGKRTALVTIVEFSDLQCPFCRKAAATVEELKKSYGPDRLRIVWKNNPLPFHSEARPAAEAAMALFESGGDVKFWAYHDRVFGSTGALNKAVFEDALRSLLVTQQEIDKVVQRGAVAKKVDADMALAKRLGLNGTPSFMINGVVLIGAQPVEKFREIIDAELAKSKELLAAGVAPNDLYAKASAKNFTPPAQRPSASPRPNEDDKTVYRVPVGGSPVKGKPSALVTIVEFGDFQCPFCIRVQPALDAVLAKYGDKVRLVWKHQPLPFHQRAEPAAQLAIEARAQKGDAGFWKTVDLLWDANGKLSDEELAAIATSAGLKAQAAMSALAKHKHTAVIEADQDLADDVKASGTPHFFINGRRLVGAQPLEKFQAMIDEELAKAEALVAKGTPAAKVYETLQKEAKPSEPLPKVNVPAAGKDSPSRGAANAKVVIQIFSDFQCPFCQRAEATLTELEAAFPGKIRLAWRNMPLSMHPQAEMAAEAALEARAQKGDAGFWKMHALLFQNQSEAGLNRAALAEHAAALGLDATKFSAALDNNAHKDAVERDKKIAEAAGIRGTPAFVINGYLLSGAQPLSKFKKLVNRALSEAK